MQPIYFRSSFVIQILPVSSPNGSTTWSRATEISANAGPTSNQRAPHTMEMADVSRWSEGSFSRGLELLRPQAAESITMGCEIDPVSIR